MTLYADGDVDSNPVPCSVNDVWWEDEHRDVVLGGSVSSHPEISWCAHSNIQYTFKIIVDNINLLAYTQNGGSCSCANLCSFAL